MSDPVINPAPVNLGHIRAAMRKEWDDQSLVALRRKWRPKLAIFSRGVTQAMLDAAQLRPGMQVLDVACGLGDPAFSIAESIGPSGRVVATDFSAPMIAAAGDISRELGVTNITFRVADALSLPFPEQSFDLVTCRWGVMYFPDPAAAIREFLRVLRPGGRSVVMAWGPPEQPLFENTIAILKKYVHVPPPEPGMPSPFAFSVRGTLEATFVKSGFVPAHEEALEILATWDGTAEEHWQQFQETAAPYKALIGSLSPEARQKAEVEILAAMRRYSDGKKIQYPLLQVLATGIRP